MPSLGWPLGTPSQVGTRHLSCAVSPGVPAVALGSPHCASGQRVGSVSPQPLCSCSDVPDPTSAFQPSPVLPALESNTNESSSRAALICYESRETIFKKFHVFYPDKHPHVLNSAFSAKAFSSPPGWSLPSKHSWTQLLWALLAGSPCSVPPEGSSPQGLDRITPIHGYLSNHLFALAHREPITTPLLVFRLLHTWQSHVNSPGVNSPGCGLVQG